MFPGSTARKEEDDLLQYAHIERTVQKTYAIRYRGYPDELPHVFTKHMVDRKLRGKHEFIYFTTLNETETPCCRGDWIVLEPQGHTSIMTDDDFKHHYQSVDDLRY